MFFMGTYTPKLDDKGRLFLPAKFRDQLAEGLVVTRGQEFCLTVWPMADFMELTRRAQE
ncbi:MAG: cell division protein MraZ, partial [Nocardioides sp.]|nr:cell division protein MraZ [Nocardioides sp.]